MVFFFDEVNRTTSVKEGNGKLIISKSSLMYVELRFTLWLAQDDYVNQVQDTSMTSDKIVVQEFIRIRNNKVFISESLIYNKAIRITETDDIILIELINFEHSFKVAKGVNMDDLVARVSAFSEFDNDRFTREMFEASNKRPNFQIAPNPNNGNFTIHTIDSPSDQKIEVKLFNIEGFLVQTLYNGYFSKESDDAITLQVDELSEGVYFLLIIGQGFVETKKLIIAKK